MNPFFNPDDIQKQIDNAKKPFTNGLPFDDSSFQKQVNESINQFLPDFMQNQQPPSSNPAQSGQQQPKQPQPKSGQHQVFETHDFVIARIPLQNQESTRVMLDSNHLYIKNFPAEGKKLNLRLPAPIQPKYAKAEIRHGVLEVRMMKQREEPTEIKIKEK